MLSQLIWYYYAYSKRHPGAVQGGDWKWDPDNLALRKTWQKKKKKVHFALFYHLTMKGRKPKIWFFAGQQSSKLRSVLSMPTYPTPLVRGHLMRWPPVSLSDRNPPPISSWIFYSPELPFLVELRAERQQIFCIPKPWKMPTAPRSHLVSLKFSRYQRPRRVRNRTPSGEQDRAGGPFRDAGTISSNFF